MATNVLRFDKGTGGGRLQVSYTASSTAAALSDDSAKESVSAVIPPGAATQTSTKVVPIMDLGGPELRLAHPVYVNIEESDGFIVALSYDLELAEQGDTEFEALNNLRAAILELFVAVKEMGSEAPPHLARKLAFLESLAL